MMPRGHPHDSLLFDLKASSSSLSPNRAHVYSYDLAGRLLSAFEEGSLYKRSLASDVHLRRTIEQVRERRVLTRAEALEVFTRAHASVQKTMGERLEAPQRERLERILTWTPERLIAERERFSNVYAPISILPPDQYHAVVLQATFGCSWNRCTYCNFYQNRPFSTKTPEAFREHTLGVKAFLGEGERLRKSIFLADGNALILANRRLEPIIRTAQEVFPERPLYGFVDVFTGERRSEADWAELKSWGLRRVYIGLETGNDELLAWMNKPGSSAAAFSFISTLKAAGLAVSTIIMVGAGGEQYAERHEEDTLELITRLPLGEGDIVYLSPFVEHPDSVYAAKAAAEGVKPLTDVQREEQYGRLEAGIKRAHPKVKRALYHIEEFIY